MRFTPKSKDILGLLGQFADARQFMWAIAL
jgi:hypothetical protein